MKNNCINSVNSVITQISVNMVSQSEMDDLIQNCKSMMMEPLKTMQGQLSCMANKLNITPENEMNKFDLMIEKLDKITDYVKNIENRLEVLEREIRVQKSEPKLDELYLSMQASNYISNLSKTKEALEKLNYKVTEIDSDDESESTDLFVDIN